MGSPNPSGQRADFAATAAQRAELRYCKMCPLTVRIADPSSLEASAFATPWSKPSTGSCYPTGASCVGTTSSSFDGWRPRPAPPERASVYRGGLEPCGDSWYPLGSSPEEHNAS